MNNYTFYYKVLLYFEGGKNPYKAQSGLGLCDSFADAASKLETYYGDDIVSVLHLELGEDTGGLILLPDKVCRDFMNNDCYDELINCNRYGAELTEGEEKND